MNNLTRLLLEYIQRDPGSVTTFRLPRGLGIAIYVADVETIRLTLSRRDVPPSSAECQIVERDLRQAAASINRQILAYTDAGSDTTRAKAGGQHHLRRYQIRLAPVANPLPLETAP